MQWRLAWSHAVEADTARDGLYEIGNVYQYQTEEKLKRSFLKPEKETVQFSTLQTLLAKITANYRSGRIWLGDLPN
jgi:hypothetical protein